MKFLNLSDFVEVCNNFVALFYFDAALEFLQRTRIVLGQQQQLLLGIFLIAPPDAGKAPVSQPV